MPTVKEYNIKLSRLKNTRKMTRTMKMVAANKLRKAQEAQRNVAEFSVALGSAMDRLLRCAPTNDVHPLMKQQNAPRRILALVITSDRGLCGGFNNNLNRLMAKWIGENSAEDKDVHVSFCGKRGFMYLKNKVNVLRHYEGVMHRPTFADASRIGNELQSAFLKKQFDEVWLAYNVFRTVLSQKPDIVPLLPLSLKKYEAPRTEGSDVLLEPDAAAVMDTLAPKVVNVRLFAALADSFAGEHGSRMTAMENATNNAEELIESYTLLRNRARQAAITRELIEIISGAEALRAVS
jgi:F-type H+-transporting ATPase subunit gamma